MDINDFRSVTTVLGLACFLAIAVWAFSPGRKARFEEAANLPFTDDDELPAPRLGQRAGEGKAS
jgi:cytochrome c oxidase cbb3-type subunit IV